MNSLPEQPSVSPDTTPEDDPKATHYSLAPPIGTMYWKRNVFQWSTVTDFGTSDWSAEIYVYVSSASPDDPNFTAKGGLVTVVMVHSGNFVTTDSVELGFQFLNTITPSTRPMYMQQFPEEWDGEVIGDPSDERRRYTINYKEDLPMFNNGGNDTFTFNASYENDYERHNTSQGSESTSALVFYVTTTTKLDNNTIIPLQGLSVFRFADITAFPLTLDFDTGYGSWAGPKSLTIDLDFATA